MHFDTTTGEFNALIKIDTHIKAPTAVYMHQDDKNLETIWYPNGFDFSVE